MIGYELRRLRTRRGLTLTEIAAAISVTHAAVSQWENGKRRIHPAFARLLRLYFAGKLSELKPRSRAKPFRTGGGRSGRSSRKKAPAHPSRTRI
jgi:transcriptional regulator with XRE-family HTH domain